MSNRRLAVVYFFILILVVLGHFLGWLKAPEYLASLALNRLGNGLYQFRLSINELRDRWTSYRQLADANQVCLNRLRSLAFNQADYQKTKEENDFLRAQLNFLKSRTSYVVAEIVGKSPEPSANLLIINAGKDKQVKINQPVVAGEGFLVGKIVKTEVNRSWVRLLNDNQSKIAASILNKNKTAGVLNGEYGLSLRLTMVPQNENLSTGDFVVTSGLENGLPRGLLVGQVETVKKEPYEPFQNATVKPMIDLNKLSLVTVLLD